MEPRSKNQPHKSEIFSELKIVVEKDFYGPLEQALFSSLFLQRLLHWLALRAL